MRCSEGLQLPPHLRQWAFWNRLRGEKISSFAGLADSVVTGFQPLSLREFVGQP